MTARFLAPRQTLFGAGASAEVGAALRAQGAPAGRALVVADRVVADAGLLTTLLEGLRAAGFAPAVFDGVAGEPTDAVVAAALAVAGESGDADGRGAPPVAVIGAGGGSAMDLAKVVALLLSNGGELGDWFGVIEPPLPLLPLALVPTTTGTGSEATRISMITVGGHKKVISCAAFLPWVAALDADLVAGLPPAVVAATGLDALAHAVESVLSTQRTFLTVPLAESAIETLVARLPAAVRGDRDARGDVLHAAHLAGLALNAGVVLGHSLAYAIAHRKPLPHGTTCAIALPYCLADAAAADPAVLDPALRERLARRLTGGASGDLRAAARAVADLTAAVGQPTSLAAVDLVTGPAEAEAMAGEVVRDYPRPNHPHPFGGPSGQARLAVLVGRMAAGDLDAAFHDHTDDHTQTVGSRA